MDMPIRFDFIEYTKILLEAGVPRDQAEAHALALTKAISEGTASSSEMVLARQEFLMRMEVMKQELLARIDAVRQELLAHMDLQKQELLMRMDLRIDQLRQELAAQIDIKIAQLRAELMPKINLAIWLSSLSLAGTLINSAMLIYLIASRHI